MSEKSKEACPWNVLWRPLGLPANLKVKADVFKFSTYIVEELDFLWSEAHPPREGCICRAS